MARRIAIDLMLNDVNQGDANRWVDWPGGDGVFFAESSAWGGGSAKLEMQTRNGTAVGVINYATTTAISLGANGMANFRAPAGKLRVTVATATGVYASVVGVPANVAG